MAKIEAKEKELTKILDTFVYDDGGIEVCLSRLGRTNGVENVEFVDSGIDDGIDDGTNDYLMKSCYDITYKGHTFYVRFFYGDIDMVIGCYDIQ